VLKVGRSRRNALAKLFVRQHGSARIAAGRLFSHIQSGILTDTTTLTSCCPPTCAKAIRPPPPKRQNRRGVLRSGLHARDHNFPRARAFLGDAGSHLVGYLLAVLAILPHFYTAQRPRHLAVLIPLLVLAVPLLDLVWVVVLRWRRGQPFYQGDTNHLSHRLVRTGLSRTQTVLLIWLLAGLLGAVACVS